MALPRTARPRLNLARKYRPHKLSELRGQDQAVKFLSEALKTDRIGPAYLFSGPRGVGKTSAARIFAKAVSCLDVSNRPCDVCASCVAIQNSQSMDLIEMDGASHTGVDDVRSIIEAANYRPSVGARTVYIVDEVHMLSQAAFNALLKTLEEPPPHVLFIFATTEIHKIPETILSRVQRVELKRISEPDLIKSLHDIAELEKVKASSEVLSLVAGAADGAFRDAQTLLEQILVLSGGNEASLEIADQLLGTIGTAQEVKLLTYVADRSLPEAIQWVHDFFIRGKDLVKIQSKLVQWVRALHVSRFAPQFKSLEIEYDAQALAALKLAFASWSDTDLDRLFEVLWTGFERIKRSELPHITLESTLIRAAQLPRTRDLSQLISLLEQKPELAKVEAGDPKREAPRFSVEAPNSFRAPPPAKIQNAVPATSTPPPISAKAPQNKEELFHAVRAHKPSFFPLLQSSAQSELQTKALILHYPAGHFAVQQLNEPILKNELQALMSKLLHRDISLEIVVSEKKAPLPGQDRGDFMKEAKSKALLDPKVAKAAEILQGKVTSITIEGVKT